MATVVKGSDRKLKLVFKTKTEEPLDLTECTEIVATFLDENGEAAQLKLSEENLKILSKAGGVVEISLASAFTQTLKQGERLDFQLDFTIGGKSVVHIFESQLNVKSKMGA